MKFNPADQGVKGFVRRILPEPARKVVQFFTYERIGGPLTYNQDGLATRNNADFMKDPRFMEAYRAGEKTDSWNSGQIHWRMHVACWAANRAKDLEGDFIECGVNRGGSALTVMHYINFASLPKKFYLLDTFDGLRQEQVSPSEWQRGIRPGGYVECYDAVCKTFQSFSNVAVIRGAVPDTLPQVLAEKVAYLYIDMNCAAPEIAAAEYFWDKLVSGAVMVLDDYGGSRHIEQKRAFDDFAARKGVQVLSLPTVQGLIFKP